MKDQSSTKQSLIEELTTLRQRVADMERVESERKQAEEDRTEKERLFSAFMQHFPGSVYIKDSDRRIIYLTGKVKELLGVNPDEWLGKTSEEIWPFELAEKVRYDDEATLRGEIVQSITERPLKDELRTWVTHRFPIHRQNKPPLIGCISFDITERKQVDEALRESEGRYKRLLDSVTDYIYTVQVIDGRPVSTVHGAGCAAVTGYASEDYQADSYLWHRMIYAQDRDAVTGHAARVIAGETAAELEHRIVHRNGSVRWVRNTPVTHYDERRCLVAYDGLISNITERKQAEEKLRESEAFIKGVLNALTSHIAVLNEKGDIVAVNDAWKQFARENNSADESFYIGSNYLTVCENAIRHGHDETGETVLQGIHAIMRGEQNEFSLEYPCPSPAENRWFIVRVTRLQAEGPVSLVVAHENITERKRAEEEQLEMERRLLHTQRLESLGVLAGGIAHDFNNLLMVILGNLEMTRLDLPPSSRTYPFIEASISATMRAADITRQMLDYSGKGGFMLKPVDLTLLVEAMNDMLKTSISKTAVLRLDLSPLLPSVLADARQMQQVVLNLIINASEAIGEETGVVSLRTGVDECDDVYLGNSRLEEKPPPGRFAFIEVSDTGCGMDEETQHRLFDPFFSTKFAGRGLGMSALQGIVRGHKGAIMVDSDVGKGTTIRVLFPAMAKGKRKQKPSVVPVSTPSEKAAFSGTALLVDDELVLRDLCKTILEHFGFRVLTASDGEECVKVFSAHADEITCVILDLTMPKMDGAAAFIELNRIRPDVPVILSSGYDKTEATRRFTGKGLAGFIQKPYEIKTLRNELERVLKTA